MALSTAQDSLLTSGCSATSKRKRYEVPDVLLPTLQSTPFKGIEASADQLVAKLEDGVSKVCAHLL
jgi:hypothetical protein